MTKPDEDQAPSARARLREVGATFGYMPSTLGHQRARGPEDGPPALVIPGFLASDRHTTQLRRALAAAGFRVSPWRGGMNWGAKADTLERLTRALEGCSASAPVLVVGWSLGGLYARELARAAPDKVRAVVTLGSPVWGDRRRYTNVWKLYERIAGHPVDQPPIAEREDKPPVPTLALWSRRDGLVGVPSARGTEATRDRAVELESSHVGFAMSPRWTRAVVHEIVQFLSKVESPA